LLARAAFRPLRAVLDARRAVRPPGAAVARQAGISRARQFAHVWRLRVVHGVEWYVYYRHRLFLDERRPRARGVVRVPELKATMEAIQARTPSPDYAVFQDKREYEAWCARHRLPTAAALVEVERGVVVQGSAASLPAADLFTKLTNSYRSERPCSCPCCSSTCDRGCPRDSACRSTGCIGSASTPQDVVALVPELPARAG